MKTVKVMGIIGIVMAVLCILFAGAWISSDEGVAAAGLGMYSGFYLIAYSIVGIVQGNKHKE